MTKPIILTGDRPTGKLHLGHYVGSLKNRVLLHSSGNFAIYGKTHLNRLVICLIFQS